MFKLYTISITAILFQLIGFPQTNISKTPQELMLKVAEAIKENDTLSFQNYLITNDSLTVSDTKIFTELFFTVHSMDKYKELIDERGKKVNLDPLKEYLIGVYIISLITDFEKVASDGSYDINENDGFVKYRISNDYFFGEQKYRLHKMKNQWYFWPDNIKKPQRMEKVLLFTRRYQAAMIDSRNDKELQDAINKLIDYFSRATSLQFENKPLSGKINGENWIYLTGNLKYQSDSSLKCMLYNTKNISVCEFSLSNPCIMFSVPKEGSFDFNLIPETPTIYIPNGNNLLTSNGKCEIYVDKKTNTAKGKLTIKYNDSNFINGNFILSICNY